MVMRRQVRFAASACVIPDKLDSDDAPPFAIAADSCDADVCAPAGRAMSATAAATRIASARPQQRLWHPIGIVRLPRRTSVHLASVPQRACTLSDMVHIIHARSLTNAKSRRFVAFDSVRRARVAARSCGTAAFPPLSRKFHRPTRAPVASNNEDSMADATVTRDRAGSPRVGLLVTCLVDLIRPAVAFAAGNLLDRAGCRVDVPRQTCCGQPAFNSGDRRTARELAAAVVTAFEPYDYVVTPSGSCGGMMKVHYPELFHGDPNRVARVDRFCATTYELVSFLVDGVGVERVEARFAGSVTYHDSCSGLRELGIAAQPRRLLAGVEGLELIEMRDANVCCGFGGTFCVKYPDISNAIVGKKADHIAATGAATLLAGDLGCLMNMAGKLQRGGYRVEARHVAEVLAGMTNEPAIGEAAKPPHDTTTKAPATS